MKSSSQSSSPSKPRKIRAPTETYSEAINLRRSVIVWFKFFFLQATGEAFASRYSTIYVSSSQQRQPVYGFLHQLYRKLRGLAVGHVPHGLVGSTTHPDHGSDPTNCCAAGSGDTRDDRTHRHVQRGDRRNDHDRLFLLQRYLRSYRLRCRWRDP